MTPASRFLWELAGRPTRPGVKQAPAGGVCLVCGGSTDGLQVESPKSALGANYDYTQAARLDSILVCLPCAWALAGKPPVTLRMWTIAATTERPLPPSHPRCVVDLGAHVHLTNRADMRAVADLLCDPPDGEWLVTVAVSGQRHVVPYAATNHGRGPWRVRVEDVDVTSDPDEMRMLLGHVAALRAAGFGPDQIHAVDPGTSLSTRVRLEAWRAHAEPLVPYRCSPLLHLAVLIPNKEHLDEYLHRYSTPDTTTPISGVGGAAGSRERHRADPAGGDDPGRGAQLSLY